VNLRLMGLIENDLSSLRAYCDRWAKATHTAFRRTIPLSSKPFRTATGFTLLRSSRRFAAGDARSGGRGPIAAVPSISLASNKLSRSARELQVPNVLYWLSCHNIPATDEVVNRIFDAAKQSSASCLPSRNCWPSAHRPALRHKFSSS